MKPVLIAAGVIVLVVVIVLAAGAMLPVSHHAQRTALIQQSADQVFGMITARWQPLPAHDGRPMWQEMDQRGRAIRYEQVAAEPPRKLVTRIADKNLPFGGTWTYELKEADRNSTELTIPKMVRYITRCSGSFRDSFWATRRQSTEL